MDQHVTTLIPDYILGLLPQVDRRQVEGHIAGCVACRQALDDERAFELVIRQTLQVATQPGAGQLQRLRPMPTPRRLPVNAFVGRQLAPVMLLLALIAGSIALQANHNTGRVDFAAPGFYRVDTPTATSTSTPTATIAGLPLAAPPTAVSMVNHQTSGTQATGMARAPQPVTESPDIQPLSTPAVNATQQPISNRFMFSWHN